MEISRKMNNKHNRNFWFFKKIPLSFLCTTCLANHSYIWSFQLSFWLFYGITHKQTFILMHFYLLLLFLVQCTTMGTIYTIRMLLFLSYSAIASILKRTRFIFWNFTHWGSFEAGNPMFITILHQHKKAAGYANFSKLKMI